MRGCGGEAARGGLDLRRPGAASVIVATVAAVAGYDVYLAVAGGEGATISQVLYRAAKRRPIVAAALGVLVGHLFWPQELG